MIQLEHFSNPIKAQEMQRYMKDKFPFIGLAMPKRKALSKSLIKVSKQWDPQYLMTEICSYYQKDYREYQYLAIDLILANLVRITWQQWQDSLLPLVDQKAWWESVDALRKPLGLWLKNNPEQLKQFIPHFSVSVSMWLRRIAITVQLNYKKATNTLLLKDAITCNAASPEFFIQKAIGWALRKYSKTNAPWVKQFMAQQHLMPLSYREASKYIKKSIEDL